MKKGKIKLFLVDDDAVFLKSLEIDFTQHADFSIETFATGELLCREFKPQTRCNYIGLFS